jgi:hypothetical protein
MQKIREEHRHLALLRELIKHKILHPYDTHTFHGQESRMHE